MEGAAMLVMAASSRSMTSAMMTTASTAHMARFVRAPVLEREVSIVVVSFES
jgi:hypothetical protein